MAGVVPTGRRFWRVPLSDCVSWVWWSRMRLAGPLPVTSDRAKVLPRSGYKRGVSQFLRADRKNCDVCVQEKKRPMDWPTGQEVNRQPRALLSVLLIGVVAFFGWRWWNSTRSDQDGGAEIVFSEVATRGGTLTSSLRSDKTFNRIVTQVRLVIILTGSKLIGSIAPLKRSSRRSSNPGRFHRTTRPTP